MASKAVGLGCHFYRNLQSLRLFSAVTSCRKDVVYCSQMAVCLKNPQGHLRLLSTVTKHGLKLIDFDCEEVQCKIGFLCSELECSEEESKQVVRKYPRLLSMAESKIASILKLFQSHSISKEEVLTYPEIFTYSLKTLQRRFELIKTCSLKIKLVDVKDAEKYFTRRVQRSLTDARLVEKFGTKSDLVKMKLGCSDLEAWEFIDSMQAMTLVNLESKLDCLLIDMTLPTELLLENPWILFHSKKFLYERHKRLESEGIGHGNCDNFLHLLTVERSHFEKRLEQFKVERKILGSCKDSTEYLCMRLGCDKDDVVKMATDFRKLLSVNVRKIKEHLDFLLEDLSLAPSDIICYPRVLSFASKTIRERYDTLVERGFTRNQIDVRMLQMSTRSFTKLVGESASVG